MKIIRANHLGMCFGVRDAIDLAKRTAAQKPVTVLGQLVHNQHVLGDLVQHGVRFANEPTEARTATVMITAHGASDKRLTAARSAGHQVIEATCPLVHQAHRELRMLLMAGYHPVIIGKPDHVEVLGMIEDLASFGMVETKADVDQLTGHSKLGIVAQTTQPIDRVNELVALIRDKFPQSDVLFMDTVCRPTKDRQTAAIDLAKRCSVIVVIGGKNSNNTHELVATCGKYCERVYHVESADDLRASWIEPNDTVGITAGTSTPDWIVNSVEAALKKIHSKSEDHEIQPSADDLEPAQLAANTEIFNQPKVNIARRTAPSLVEAL
jgi:4-hydroxy-3-methylbut-2-enyl diphosphate reductase